MLMLAGLFAAENPLPYSAVAAIPLVWAGVESVLSIRARAAAPAPARAGNQAPTRGIVSGIIGLVLVCLLSVMVLLPYAFYGTEKRLQDCRVAANTAIAAGDCNTRYGGLESILSDLLSAG
jgi:hypothetical protein